MALDTSKIENSSSGSQVVPCGRTYGQWIDMTKLIVAFSFLCEYAWKTEKLCQSYLHRPSGIRECDKV